MIANSRRGHFTGSGRYGAALETFEWRNVVTNPKRSPTSLSGVSLVWDVRVETGAVNAWESSVLSILPVAQHLFATYLRPRGATS